MNDNNFKLLVVDDEEEMLENYARLLKKIGYSCVTEKDSSIALQIISKDRPDIVLADLRMPDKDGFDVLRYCQELDPDILVILITAYATIEKAVKAVKEGAFDFLPKPFSIDQLNIVIQRALNQKMLKEENKNLSRQLKEALGLSNIVGKSSSMTKIFEMVSKVAKTDSNIFIAGESGTGKELIARSLHANSPRFKMPFIPIDCASLPENLLENELFGHEKGAFTGAHKTKKGLFEEANGGTIFLDEIGDMGVGLQAKLLRVIQERHFRRVGGNTMIDVDVRIISATNKNIQERIAKGLFREDLYYRMNVISLKLPSLRERKEDVPLLAKFFIRKFSSSYKDKLPIIDAQTLKALESYDWPGNVRELQNVIERALAIMDDGVIKPTDLPDHIREKGLKQEVTSESIHMSYQRAKELWIASFEKEYLSKLLRDCRGNISRAAIKAKMNRRTIHRLLNKFNISY